MAKYDVYRLRSGGPYVLDCQADLLSALNTRLVVPLMPVDEAPKPAARLNPVFAVQDEPLIMMTQFAASVPLTEMEDAQLSLREQRDAIDAALDMLIIGF